MPIAEALASDVVLETTKELIRAVLSPEKQVLQKSSFVNKRFEPGKWQLFV